MNKTIFREKSIQKVKSPEKLDDFLHIANPGVWAIMITAVIFMAGVIVAACTRNIEIGLKCGAVCNDGVLTLYVPEKYSQTMNDDMTVQIKGLDEPAEVAVNNYTTVPLKTDDSFDKSALHISGLNVGDWLIAVECPCNIDSGVYESKLITERIRPIEFILSGNNYE